MANRAPLCKAPSLAALLILPCCCFVRREVRVNSSHSPSEKQNQHAVLSGAASCKSSQRFSRRTNKFYRLLRASVKKPEWGRQKKKRKKKRQKPIVESNCFGYFSFVLSFLSYSLHCLHFLSFTLLPAILLSFFLFSIVLQIFLHSYCTFFTFFFFFSSSFHSFICASSAVWLCFRVVCLSVIIIGARSQDRVVECL